jgi:hypothetical protein
MRARYYFPELKRRSRSCWLRRVRFPTATPTPNVKNRGLSHFRGLRLSQRGVLAEAVPATFPPYAGRNLELHRSDEGRPTMSRSAETYGPISLSLSLQLDRLGGQGTTSSRTTYPSLDKIGARGRATWIEVWTKESSQVCVMTRYRCWIGLSLRISEPVVYLGHSVRFDTYPTFLPLQQTMQCVVHKCFTNKRKFRQDVSNYRRAAPQNNTTAHSTTHFVRRRAVTRSLPKDEIFFSWTDPSFAPGQATGDYRLTGWPLVPMA